MKRITAFHYNLTKALLDEIMAENAIRIYRQHFNARPAGHFFRFGCSDGSVAKFVSLK
jgi:hypothetical protein